jgi:hypothetical protein
MKNADFLKYFENLLITKLKCVIIMAVIILIICSYFNKLDFAIIKILHISLKLLILLISNHACFIKTL